MHNTQLIGRPNVVFTPHIGFNSVEAVGRINRATIANINAGLPGKPVNVVGTSNAIGLRPPDSICKTFEEPTADNKTSAVSSSADTTQHV